MSTQDKSIAVLCAGGPAPGINTVIGTIAKRFLSDGFKVYGIHFGYKTLFSENVDCIDLDFVISDSIINKGGSYLKMSRYKPKDSEFNSNFFEENNVKLLVTIGGDDTASTANRLTAYLKNNNISVQNIHVPKTIDNDLPLPENTPTFGFQSAKNEGVRTAVTVYEDARTADGWFIVAAMGREAGHLTLGIGVSAHYPIIIIPEMFNKVDVTFERIIKIIVSSIVKRKLMGISYGCAIISEGVFHYMNEKEIINSGIKFTFDAHGHPELAALNKAHLFNTLLQEELKKLDLNLTRLRPVEIGFEIRCSAPTAFDLNYCTALGNGVKKLFDRGETACIVLARINGEAKPLYLKDITDENGKVKPRLVDIESDEFLLYYKNMEFVKEVDYQDAKEYLENPEEYNLDNILGWKV